MKRAFFILLLTAAFLLSVLPVSSENSTVKVLLYHNLSDSAGSADNPCLLSVAGFTEQMEWLMENGFVCLTVSGMFERLNGGGLPEKAAVITFDDGYPGVFYEAYPVLRDLGCPATAYLVAEKIGMPGNLSAEMIRELYEAGWEIGSHGSSHSDLLESDDLDPEICGSRKLISGLTGIPVQEISSFAYPYGNADERIMTKVWKCGYLSGAGLGQIPVTKDQNPYYFPRHSITPEITIEEFAALLGKAGWDERQ